LLPPGLYGRAEDDVPLPLLPGVDTARESCGRKTPQSRESQDTNGFDAMEIIAVGCQFPTGIKDLTSRSYKQLGDR
jgi:hypothetical protein